MNFNATLYCVAEPNFVIMPKNNRPIQTRPSVKDFEIWILDPPITIDFFDNGPDPVTSNMTFNPLKGTVSRILVLPSSDTLGFELGLKNS